MRNNDKYKQYARYYREERGMPLQVIAKKLRDLGYIGHNSKKMKKNGIISNAAVSTLVTRARKGNLIALAPSEDAPIQTATALQVPSNETNLQVAELVIKSPLENSDKTRILKAIFS